MKSKDMPLPWALELEAYRQKKRAEIEEALLVARGRVSVAAEALKVARTTLRRWVEEYQLEESVANMRLEAGMGARVQKGSLKGRVMGRPCKSKKT